MKAILFLALLIPTLTACDQLKERIGIPVPEKIEAEGKAIGSACRHAGRGLEDCFSLNPRAEKAAIHSGWKEMNEYMIKNNMQAVTPEIVTGKARKFVPFVIGDENKAKDEDESAHGKQDKASEAHAKEKSEAKAKH